ncbi:hypothetical protein GQ55_2G069000 [Panicum hallii var. hallii]|uniref:Uncharacterized protein n=2 Tax=Panicum hallii TaxID=206008 RepID=A0A2T7EM89_9POAL|nr:hypothetical protein GQ55_2G069000 [Panicum hallii var. hallii]
MLYSARNCLGIHPIVSLVLYAPLLTTQAMKLLIDESGNPSQIGKDWKDLELIQFVDIKTCIERQDDGVQL